MNCFFWIDQLFFFSKGVRTIETAIQLQDKIPIQRDIQKILGYFINMWMTSGNIDNFSITTIYKIRQV